MPMLKHACMCTCVCQEHTCTLLHREACIYIHVCKPSEACVRASDSTLHTHLHICVVYMHACTQTHDSAPSTRGQGVNVSQQEDLKFLIMTRLVLQMEL